MSNFGVTDEGFILKRLQDILTEQRAKAVELFQDLTAPGDVVDTSDSSALGRLINMDAFGDADLWEVAQLTYTAMDPNSATGVALDNIVQYGGISRQAGSYTTAPVLLTGDINTIVPLGSVIASSDTNIRFSLRQDVGIAATSANGVIVVVNNVTLSDTYTITYEGTSTSQTVTYVADPGHTVSDVLNGLVSTIQSTHPNLTAVRVGNTLDINKTDIFQASTFSVSTNLNISKAKKIGEVVAETLGPIDQQVGTLSVILTPVLGWTTVTNPSPTVPGQVLETDEELRIRFRNSKFEKATNILDALYSALIAVDNVDRVVIYENDTSAVDANGIPAHSFMPIVLGGASNDISQTIWENKPIGILSYGNTSVEITDVQGFPHAISFERPNPVTVYISINLTIDQDFPEQGNSNIKAALIEYFNENFNIGEEVVYSRLYTPINSVPGHQVNSLKIGVAPNPTGSINIPIAFNQISSLSDTNIIIT